MKIQKKHKVESKKPAKKVQAPSKFKKVLRAESAAPKPDSTSTGQAVKIKGKTITPKAIKNKVAPVAPVKTPKGKKAETAAAPEKEESYADKWLKSRGLDKKITQIKIAPKGATERTGKPDKKALEARKVKEEAELEEVNPFSVQWSRVPGIKQETYRAYYADLMDADEARAEGYIKFVDKWYDLRKAKIGSWKITDPDDVKDFRAAGLPLERRSFTYHGAVLEGRKVDLIVLE